jgi:hypothetical protein
MVNVFKTVLQARKFLKMASKATNPVKANASSKLALEAWRKKTGHSTTVLKDMARKMSAKSNKNVRHSKKYDY